MANRVHEELLALAKRGESKTTTPHMNETSNDEREYEAASTPSETCEHVLSVKNIEFPHACVAASHVTR